MILFILMIEALCTFKRELWLFLFLSHPKGCFYVIRISDLHLGNNLCSGEVFYTKNTTHTHKSWWSLNVVVLSLSSQCSINIEFLPSFHHSSSLTLVNQSARVCLCVSACICAQPDRLCGLTLPNQYLPDVNFFLSWNNLIFMINDQGGYVIHSVQPKRNMMNALLEPSIFRNNFYLIAHNL